MPIDIHHHRRADLDWSELITCPHCGNRARGRVAVTGVGEGTAHGGLFNEDAHQRAGIDAFDKAASSVQQELVGKLYSKEELAMVIKYRDEYRAAHKK